MGPMKAAEWMMLSTFVLLLVLWILGPQLGGLVADGDHGVEWLPEIPIERLALLGRDVDAQLPHRSNRQRPDVGRFGSGREHLESVVSQMAQQPLGHLTARRVVGAEKQHPLLTLTMSHSGFSPLRGLAGAC